ncbi:NlpC/P60 family protein [Klebsiella sp. MS 92-3]|uniref:NlpC/P60 family protein n=1 Tax=Klebsiella sp. MS 92-3 TaxID=749535 RepID=UPI0002ED424D|nr:NlpC/P60 family protein [Klebsiella sp. MS 92-3]
MKPKLTHALFLIPFLLLAGCSSSPKQAKNTKSHADMTIDGGSDDLIPVVAALHDQMHTWQGTPYEWGGTEQSGVDCSGFVWRTLKDRFTLPMERITTRELLHMGVRVNKRDLRPGDLVFFRTRAGMHVGFYDTDHNFLHASSSQGVMRSSLDNPYWESAFYQARRLPKEYNAQITMNSDTLHLAKNRR